MVYSNLIQQGTSYGVMHGFWEGNLSHWWAWWGLLQTVVIHSIPWWVLKIQTFCDFSVPCNVHSKKQPILSCNQSTASICLLIWPAGAECGLVVDAVSAHPSLPCLFPENNGMSNGRTSCWWIAKNQSLLVFKFKFDICQNSCVISEFGFRVFLIKVCLNYLLKWQEVHGLNQESLKRMWCWRLLDWICIE